MGTGSLGFGGGPNKEVENFPLSPGKINYTST
jgi:hypothetical protein